MQKPLSPHLQIYSPQLTSMLSILHRVTGLGFVKALILVSAWLYALSEGSQTYSKFCSFIGQPFIKIVVYMIIACVYYHMINGVRYLFWSFGKGFELRSVYASGWIVCFLVLTLTILTVYFS